MVLQLFPVTSLATRQIVQQRAMHFAQMLVGVRVGITYRCGLGYGFLLDRDRGNKAHENNSKKPSNQQAKYMQMERQS